jgi:RNase P subunit RPR2
MRQRVTRTAFADGRVACAKCKKLLVREWIDDVNFMQVAGKAEPQAVMVTCMRCGTTNEFDFVDEAAND